jgi:hypothetical protein
MTDHAEKRCVDCHALAPKTATNYTLIERHGWRLTRANTPDGRKTMELRCPTCWVEYRAATTASGTHDVALGSQHPNSKKRSAS